LTAAGFGAGAAATVIPIRNVILGKLTLSMRLSRRSSYDHTCNRNGRRAVRVGPAFERCTHAYSVAIAQPRNDLVSKVW
jgi:hypothetical protein